MSELVTLEFTVPGKPMGKQRPRMTRMGHTYTPKETASYENLVKLAFREKYHDHIPTTSDVELFVVAEFPIPTSWSKKKKQAALDEKIHPRKPDWDNIGKIISDALNDVAYIDDSQVVFSRVEKKYSETPQVLVIINYYKDENADLHLEELPF